MSNKKSDSAIMFIIHRTTPTEDKPAMEYILFDNVICQMPRRLKLKPGDKLWLDRIAKERPSDETCSPDGGYAKHRKKVMVPDDNDD